MWYALLLILIVSSSFVPTTAHRTNACTPINPMNITSCKKLITLGAELGWNIHNDNKTHIDILFTIPISTNDAPKWVAWGVHPGRKRPQMIGTRAFIAISQSNGTLKVSKYNITSDTKLGCSLQPLQPSEEFEDVVVQNMTGEVKPNRYMSIFATLILRPDLAPYDIERLNHVWQVGYEADEVHLEPKMHPTALQNVDSTETTNLFNRKGISIGHRRHHLRTVHGILNMLGWGTLLPFGVIIARYYRRYPFHCKKWYFCHVSCQIVGYILGTAGWAIGIWLGHASKEYHFHTHNILAMFIFPFTTLQMIALRLRPMPTDDYRKYWDMYHHFLGYALLAVIIVNIFHGIAILKPEKTWLWAYVGILASLASIALCSEIYTWCKFMKSKMKKAAANGQTGDAQSTTQPTTTKTLSDNAHTTI
ncbi:PREDICTED: cytochrome b561 and DOMON domain-containing protein At5g35735-like [Fragaria vesca subsp. vesca]|uniref:cytochrome b561 and DOMON domain-containing protein At5g35735-like n=1 Tax=Fragaria vesca subsp. vesca TaxID=101020 RepID=UPI0002C33976|nr:PREDICTED: cytochrome b561 and DOMON domain-containing protein At5g35735-like [Fragaria vesca subsp. vesca]